MSDLENRHSLPGCRVYESGRLVSLTLAAILILVVFGASPQRSFAGFFNSSSVWNSPLPPSQAIAPNSDALIQTSFSSGANGGRLFISLNDYSVPVYYAAKATPTYSVPVSYPWSPYTVPGPGFGDNVPIPTDAMPASGSDGHMVVVDLERRLAWDFYQAEKTAAGWKATYGIRWNLDGSGVNPVWTASARAAGTPLLGGLILHSEIQSGRIPHALSMAISQIRDKEMVSPPASATQKGSTNPNYLPMGSRVQLDPDLDLNAYNITPAGRIVARALQEYGAFIVDCSGTNVIYAESFERDSSRSWQGVLSATALMNIPFDKLRVVSAGKSAEGSEEPTPTATATPTKTPSLLPTSTPTASPTATVTPSATRTATATQTPSPTWTPTPTAAATSTPSLSPTATPTPALTATNSPTPLATPVATQTMTPTATLSLTPLATSTPIPPKPTNTATATPTPESTVKPEATTSPTPSPEPTAIPPEIDEEDEPTPTPYPVVITATSNSTMEAVSAFSASSACIAICSEP